MLLSRYALVVQWIELRTPNAEIQVRLLARACNCYNSSDIMPPEHDQHEELEKLLEENLAVAKDNNRLLREMRRNAILGLIAKIVLWLIILGVPLFFLSSYLGPIMDAISGAQDGQLPSGLFGLPSEEQLNRLIEQYQAEYQ